MIQFIRAHCSLIGFTVLQSRYIPGMHQMTEKLSTEGGFLLIQCIWPPQFFDINCKKKKTVYLGILAFVPTSP